MQFKCKQPCQSPCIKYRCKSTQKFGKKNLSLCNSSVSNPVKVLVLIQMLVHTIYGNRQPAFIQMIKLFTFSSSPTIKTFQIRHDKLSRSPSDSERVASKYYNHSKYEYITEHKFRKKYLYKRLRLFSMFFGLDNSVFSMKIPLPH